MSFSHIIDISNRSWAEKIVRMNENEENNK